MSITTDYIADSSALATSSVSESLFQSIASSDLNDGRTFLEALSFATELSFGADGEPVFAPLDETQQADEKLVEQAYRNDMASRGTWGEKFALKTPAQWDRSIWPIALLGQAALLGSWFFLASNIVEPGRGVSLLIFSFILAVAGTTIWWLTMRRWMTILNFSPTLEKLQEKAPKLLELVRLQKLAAWSEQNSNAELSLEELEAYKRKHTRSA